MYSSSDKQILIKPLIKGSYFQWVSDQLTVVTRSLTNLTS